MPREPQVSSRTPLLTKNILEQVMNASRDTNMIVKSIIFLDEIESLGVSRESGDRLASTTVNPLLEAIDGISSSRNVILIGATNYPWNLDKALLDRFSKKFYVSLPTATEVEQLLNQKINNMIRKSLEKYTYTTGKKLPIAKDSSRASRSTCSIESILGSSCKKPERDVGFTWTDPEISQYIPSLSPEDIKLLARYLSGESYVDDLWTPEEDKKDTDKQRIRLSNRQISDLFKEVRDMALEYAKNRGSFVKVTPSFLRDGSSLILSSDCIPLSQIEKYSALEIYFTEPNPGSNNLKLIYEMDGEDQFEVVLTNSIVRLQASHFSICLSLTIPKATTGG